MNTLLLYMFEVALYLTAFYILYSILLSRDTSYGRNRAFILISLISAFILPLLTVQTGKFQNADFFGRWLSEVLVVGDKNTTAVPKILIHSRGELPVIYTIYFTGAFVFMIKILINLGSLIFMIARHRKQGSRIIRYNTLNTSGFSAMGYIFLNPELNEEEEAEIIRHEQNHLRQNHFIDIMFIEIVMAFQWFNPFLYLFNRSLRAVHEYQADRECLRSGTNLAGYQHLLLNQIFRSPSLSLSNSFANPSLVRKRMIMMTKKRTPGYAGMKLLLVIPVIGLLFITTSSFRKNNIENLNSQQSAANALYPDKTPGSQLLSPPASGAASGTSDTEPYTSVQYMPQFPGGDAQLLKYIAENAHYPGSAMKQKVQGRVIVRFCVTREGGITMISVLKGVSPELDSEAVRVVSTLPAFKPGMQDGKAVPVWFMVPITFTLR